MTTPLRVLYLEDNPADVELCRHTLRQAGFLVELLHVDTKAEFVSHLSDDLDIILADYSLPQFDAPRALQEVRKRGLDVPFLVISGTIGEDIAVEVIKQGAADYLLKDRLARLGTAVQQALDQRRLRKEHLAIEEALRSQDRLFRAVVENAADGIVLLREDLSLAYLSPTAESMSGSGPQDPARQNVLALIHPDDHAAARTVFQQALERPGEVQKVDLRVQEGEPARDGVAHIVTGDSPEATNDFGKERVGCHSRPLSGVGSALTYKLPPLAHVVLELEVR